MTSTNDGKDVKSNQTSGHKGKSYYIDLYKSLEKHLSEECELRERTQHLCSAWRRVHSLCQHSAHTTHPHYLAWLQRHTANTLLQSEWQSEKDEHAKLQEAIDSFIAESKAAAVSRNGHSPSWETQLVQRGEWFKKILGNPWGHPVLKVLCDPRGKPPSDEAILEWLKEERGVMFVTRLRHLAASKKCHEIALSLTTAVMERKRACETLVSDVEQAEEQEPPQPKENSPTFKDILRSEAGFTVDVWEMLTDLELVLLHKRNEHSQCIALAKKIPLRSGYQLVERLRSRPETSPREKKLWKNAGDVATLVAQVLITRCMVVGSCGGAVRSALYCCARSLARLLPAAALAGAARALAAPAATARHLHTLAAAVHTQLHAQNAEDMNSFVCELYVRAITAGMNELEKLKLKTEKESEARSMEQTLASWFTSLGSLLSCSARIQCECSLTAFSVHPSAAMFDKISAAPALPASLADKQEPKEESKSEFGSWASDSRSQTNLVKTSETLNLKQTQQHTNVMSTAIFAEGEAIGLSAELCQDLTVCLSGPRVKTLSWDMDREVLLENCRSYMTRTQGGTRALTTELRFLNLDPRQYLHLPEEGDDENDAYYGIEKGYEHLVELQEEVGWQDDFFDHEATETAYSSEEFVEIHHRRKKKSKRSIILPEDDSDPLSTITESNKGDKKKERPHSKERSKEKKKKPKSPEEKEKRKEKRERKKKEKVAKPGSLASLVGVKVTRQDGTDLVISDSDYDSQGKSSLVSEGNDPNVVFDGLFNMDDPLSDRPLVNSELSVVNGEVAVNKAPKNKPGVSKKKAKNIPNIATAETKPTHGVKSVNSLLNCNLKPRPSAVGVVSEHVKRSITKLLQFRRNQNAGLVPKSTHNTAPRADHKPINAIYKPEFPNQQFISPKSVIVPEIPKSYISKAQSESNEVDEKQSMLLNQTQTNDSMGHSLNRSDSDRQNNTLPIQSHNKSNSEVIVPPARSSSDFCGAVNKYKEILNIPSYYQNVNNNRHHSPNILNRNQSHINPKNISMSLSRVETPRAQEHARSYEDFMIDLKTAANPLSPPSVIVKKDARPVSRVSPVTPGLPYTDTTLSQQCAKQTPLKKVENAPNTFSRLSYMKNKQSDLKQKQALEAQASRPEEWGQIARTSSELSRCMAEFKNTKIKYIQTIKDETVITRVENPLNLLCGNTNVVRKAESNTSTSKSQAVVANLLQPTTSKSQMPVLRYDTIDTTKVTTPPAKTSYLSEKDQNDLLLLLRQQNRINFSRNDPKNVPPTPQATINTTTDNASNIMTSSSVVGKPVQSTSVINQNLQYANTIESKETRHLEKHNVKNNSKNASHSGGRGTKKVSKTNTNPKSKTKMESVNLDWQKVMNAIRAQKTPSRGPSALELALKSTDSIDKSLRNQRIVRTNSVGETDRILNTVDTIISHANSADTLKSSGASFPKQCSNTDVVKTSLDIQNKSVIAKTAQSNLQNTSIENKKTVKNVPHKRPSGEVDKKQVGAEKIKFATTMPKNKDPFISGREEDYNLSDLDDLLDDELRRELGELSSDEESYPIPQQQKGIKIHPCSKSDSSSKRGVGSSGSQKEKIQVQNLPHSSIDQPVEVSVSKCSYTKSKECARGQTNKTKTKASVHNSLLNQSKATSNENFNKNVLPMQKLVPQVTDVSPRYQNTLSSSTSLNKNIRKVSDPNLHYQYSTVNKVMLHEAANNQSKNSCLRDQYPGASSNNNVEEPRKVYVVPAVAQPASNILLLGSEIYYKPIPVIQNNINSNLRGVNPIFVQQNSSLNITMPQQAYCAPSVSSPHINTATDSVTRPTIVNDDKTSYTDEIDLLVTSQSQFLPNETMSDKNGQVDVKSTVKTDQPLQDNTNYLDNNVIFDINSNKNSDLCGLPEVKENKKSGVSDTTIKLSRSRSISTEEILRDILNDQDKDQTVTNDLLMKNSVGKNVLDDITEPYSKNDTERLKRKRLAIINRQIIQSSIHPPIALSYAPIFKRTSHIDVCQVKVTPQEVVDSPSKDDNHSEEYSEVVLQTIKRVLEVFGEEKSPLLTNDDETKNENGKENTSNSLKCRRIMLRSSNKNISKTPTDGNDQNPVARKTKVRLKIKAEIDKKEIKDDEIMPSKTNHKKKVKRKTAVMKNTSNRVRDSKEHSKNDTTEVYATETLPIISSGSFDIEDALLGSMIPNVKLIQPQTKSASIDAESENEKSNISTNKADNIVILQNKSVKLIAQQSTSSAGSVDEKSNASVNKVVILQNKKVSIRRKRKSLKILANNNDRASKTPKEKTNSTDIDKTTNLSDNQRVTRSVAKAPSEKQIKEICQSQIVNITVDKNCLTKTHQQTTDLNMSQVLVSDVTKQEQSNRIVNNVRNKTEDSSTESKDLVSSEKIVIEEPSQQEVKKIESKTFQSILENFIVSNNQDLEEPTESELEDLLENCQQINDREVQLLTEASQKLDVPHVAPDTDANNSVLGSSNVVESNKILHDKSQIPPNANIRSSDVVTPHIFDTDKVISNLAKLPSNVDRTSLSNVVPPDVVDSNKILHEKTQLRPKENNTSRLSKETCNIPQSYKDSIIIEEIPNNKGSDVTTLLRVKLPNGKIFKASVYGKMHTSFDSLFDDPSLRAMLMSDLNEHRKYTLNIKQVSKTNKENPDKLIETRIQEIQVKSNSIAPSVVETIDLLSDDEENDDNCCFKTKSGVFKTTIRDKDILTKHQAKFDQNCYVNLEQLVLPTVDDWPEDLQIPDTIEIDGDSDDLDEVSLPPVNLNTHKENIPNNAFDVQNIQSTFSTTQDNTTKNKQDERNVIDNDESSNDSIDLLKSCPDLAVGLIMGIPLISNDGEILERNAIVEDSSTVNSSETRVDSNIDTADITNYKNEVQTPEIGTSDTVNKAFEVSSINHENQSKTLDTTTDVTEITCNEKGDVLKDNNIYNAERESSEVFGPPKCVKPISTIDNGINLSEELLTKFRNCYVPLTRCDDLAGIYNIQNALNRGCSVSLERCDSIIESLTCLENNVVAAEMNKKNNEELDTSIDTSDAEVSSTASFSILNDLSFLPEINYTDNLVDNGRNSPVIKVFEEIACLRNKRETDKEVKMARHADKFQCEWLLTKKQMYYGSKCIEVQENTDCTNISCSHQFDDLSEKQDPYDILVPSLVSLLTLFLQNQNNNIVDRLKPSIQPRGIASKSLKRKMPKLSDHIIASKVSKSKKTAVDLILLSKCEDVEDVKTLNIPLDVLLNENKSVITENDTNHTTLKYNSYPTITNIYMETSKEIQKSKPVITNVTREDAITNSADSVTNTELAPEVTEIRPEQTSHESHECETKFNCEIVENINNDSAEIILDSQMSKYPENIIDVSLKQDILEADVTPNQNLQMDKTHDGQNSPIMIANLSSTDEVSTPVEGIDDKTVFVTAEIVSRLSQQSKDTNNVVNSPCVSSCIKTNSEENKSQQHNITDMVKMEDDDRLDIGAKTTSQDQLTDEMDNKVTSSDHQSYEITLNTTEHVTYELSSTDRRKFDYTVEVESIQATENIAEHDCVVNNINQQSNKNVTEGLNQEPDIGEITQTENLVDKQISPEEDSIADNSEFADITVSEYLKDILDIKDNIIELKKQDNEDSVRRDISDTKNNSNHERKHYEVEETNDEQLENSTVVEESEVNSCDSTTDLIKCNNKNILDVRIDTDISDIENDSCIALEVTCGDLENVDNDQIELSVGEMISNEVIKDESCCEIIPKAECASNEYLNNTVVQSAIPDHEYSCLRHDPRTTEMQTFNKHENNEKGDDNVTSCAENHVSNVESDSQKKCLIRGVEIDDPGVGKLYVLYPIDDTISERSTPNGSYGDVTETIEEIGDDLVDNNHDKDNIVNNIEILKVNIPQTTYSKQFTYGLRFKQNMKRKIDFTDNKFITKRYRKGKNIDYPKITAAAILEQGYTKEYKRVLDYSSSLKFSYTQPFHKDYFDIDNTIKNWPITGPCGFQPELVSESQCVLFADTLTIPNYEPDALKQTLVEEINQNYTEKNEPSPDINEINFNMGFGEGSGRVIQNLEDVGDISKVSAATLSDVKQPQPFLLSEDCKYNRNNTNAAQDDQVEKIQRYLSYIKLHDRVKSFFQKNFIELEYDGLSKKKEDALYNQTFDSTHFPFDLYIHDFMEPRPYEAIVQVVQVGQLPVSAAAQNPVTCDPRVTQVSNASPSQCSVENSPHDESSTPIKTEYTELTTADLSLPLVQDYAQHAQTMTMDSHEKQNIPFSGENIPIETEIKSVVKIELMEELPEEKELKLEPLDSTEIQSMEVNHSNIEYGYDTNETPSTYEMNNATNEYETTNTVAPLEEASEQMMYNSTEKQTTEDEFPEEKQKNGSPEKTDQIAHAMSAAGITTTAETIANNRAHALVNMLSQKIRQGAASSNTTTANNFSKTTSINAMALQQALAQILPPPLNQTNANDNNQQTNNNQVTPQVLHIVQGKNASGSQITLVDNSQQSVISGGNTTPVLHIVQNKAGNTGATTNGASGTQNNSFSGLSLVDAGLQQGGNQLLHIVNTGSQKNNNAGQLLKRVNLLTNLANVQGSNEQKMVQFVCKSADGKSIQLNAPHQRSMVLRLQPIESPAPTSQPKPAENQDPSQSPSATTAQNKDSASQQEIKSRSVYEENYAKFIQNSSTKPAAAAEKSTSLPKFNQAFGKPVFQEGTQKPNEITNNIPSVNTPSENNECPSADANNAINLEHISQISSPPLLLRKSPAQTSQAQTNLVQQIKQSIAPMNLQTMHGGVIYTRQIPVNIGGGQTINLITVPSTELVDESVQKQQSGNQGEMEPSIIKIVPQSQSNNNSEICSEENGNNMSASNENNQNPQPQPQPVLTQMRIKLPMLSKTPQMVSGARVVRPSFFQIQRNVIGGANQPVYQQLVLTAAPPLGQQTIRLPTAQVNRQQLKVPSETQSTESMSSSTLEQLREFDMVLEQVKERSTVQPNSNSTNSFPKLHTPSTDTTDSASSVAATPSESSQVLYSIGNNQTLNVAYVNRKTPAPTPTVSTFVRSPDSSGIADSPTSSTHVQIPHTVTTESASSETSNQPKPAKVSSKSKSRPKSSSHPPSSMKINPVPPKTSTQKPMEDEQTTQRILYILAEYKEQVENSPDKDKPAPRRRTHPPSNPGSSKRKKSSSGSRRHGGRDMSPVHGDDTCRTMGSEDSSCGTSQGDCNESCLDSHSPQDSPRKIVRKLTFEHETPVQQPRPQPQRNVIVADGQTITVARGTAGKPATAVLMPANYILPVSMVKGGQQIAIVTNRGPKLLTVGGGEGGATNALLLQRLIGPGGLKPMLARPGVRHVRLPTAALHNLQAFNLATASVQPPDSTASPSSVPTPELVETRAASSPWTDRESQDVKPERGSSPEGSEPWNLPSSADPHDYTYEETVRAENLDRTVLDAMPDRYSPDMEAQRIFDKMFDVDSKKSYIADSPRCGYDIDASDCDDKAYHQVVQRKDGSSQRHHRLTHVSAAALRHKYAILEHELRLQKSLSEECEDLGVDSPSASELFPEAELLFAASPAHDHTQDPGQHSHTPQPTHAIQSIPQPDMDDQTATDQLLPHEDELGLADGVVRVTAGLHVALDHEEFARAHPNTTFHSEPTDDAPVQPFTIAGLKGRHITSTIFHSNRAPATVLMTAPQTTVISQATVDPQAIKYDIDHMINTIPSSNNINLSSVLVKDDGLTRYDSILNDSRELHLTHTASAIVHSTGNATQVIRRVCYDDKRDRDTFLMDEPDALIAGDDAKMIAEDSSRDATMESMADVDDDRSSPERHTELFWESNSASERSESRRPLDFSSDSDKCCKSPSYDETNSTDSSGVGTHMRLDSVIKDARGIDRSGSADGSSADDTHPPLRTYPPKRMYHPLDGEMERSLTGKTRAGERSPDSLEVRRRASVRGVVKRGCHCCNGSPAPLRPKKSRQRKPTMDFNPN